MRIEIRHQEFHFLPERVLYWPKHSLLVVADLHLGKAEVFQRQGLWLPSQAQHDDLETLSRLVEKTSAREIIFLGDLVHHVSSVAGEIESLFAEWTKTFQGQVMVTLGNHDRGLDRNWPETWSHIQRGPLREIEGFIFQHDLPAKSRASDPFFWAGHLHPVVTLNDGADRLRLPCFAVTAAHGILPAFSRLAGGFDLRPSAKQRLYAVTDERVIPLGPVPQSPVQKPPQN